MCWIHFENEYSFKSTCHLILKSLAVLVWWTKHISWHLFLKFTTSQNPKKNHNPLLALTFLNSQSNFERSKILYSTIEFLEEVYLVGIFFVVFLVGLVCDAFGTSCFWKFADLAFLSVPINFPSSWLELPSVLLQFVFSQK